MTRKNADYQKLTTVTHIGKGFFPALGSIVNCYFLHYSCNFLAYQLYQQ